MTLPAHEGRGSPPEVGTYVGGDVDKLVNLRDVMGDVYLGGTRGTVALHQLPPDMADFTGREAEVARLVGLLEPSRSGAVVISAVAGKAGVGKSALAIHVAHRVAARFPHGQLYVNLRGQETQRLDPAEVLGSFSRALGVPAEAIPTGLGEREALYRSLLAGKKVLVVLDNATDEAQVRSLLAPAPSVVVITSRTRLAALGASLLDLEVMEDADATALLARVAGPGRVAAESSEATQIVALCGRLPLAVRIAGALLAAKAHWSAASLARRLADELSRLSMLRVGDLDVRASFSLTYAQLAPADARAFRLLGLVPGADFTPLTVAGLFEREMPEAEACLERLADAQLLEVLSEGRFRFHDLLRLFAVGCLDDETAEARGAARDRLLESYEALARAATELLIVSDDEARRAARAWLEAERANLVAAVARAHQDSLWARTQDLVRALVKFFSLSASWSDWVSTHELALDAARQAGDRRGENAILNDLGIVYQNQARWAKAIACYEQSLVILRDVADRHGEGKALNNLGNVYQRQARWEEAIACYKKDLTICRELGDRHGEGQTLNNLGAVYRNQGRLEDALAYYKQSLAIHRDVGDRQGQGQTLNNLGIVFRNQGRWEEALASYQQSLAIHREVGDLHGEGQTLNNLGVVHRTQGRWDEAIDCYEQALAILRKLGDRQGEGRTLNNLGIVYQLQTHWEDAIAWYEQSLVISRDLGDRHGEGRTLNNLGNLYRSQTRSKEAIACYEQSLVIMREFGDHEAEGRIQRLLEDTTIEPA